MNRFFFILCLNLMLVLSGCSTVVNGTTQTISINSDIPGADVEINGQVVGKTPFTGVIKRGKNTQIKISKQGYDVVVISPETGIATAFWGNILIGGFTGSTTDGVSGAVHEYKPNTFFVNLKKNP